MKDKIKALEYVKNAVVACLNNEATLVDLHGLKYWASEVERLRGEIKGLL